MADRTTPYGAFNYIVSFDGGEIFGGFSDVSGIGSEIKIAEYRNGNEKENHVRKVPGTHTVGDTTLKRGIVNSKTPILEDEDDLMRRMDEAAGSAGGMDRLAISPQCGFASVMVGNEIDEDTQWRKLELVVRVADRIWG